MYPSFLCANMSVCALSSNHHIYAFLLLYSIQFLTTQIKSTPNNFSFPLVHSIWLSFCLPPPLASVRMSSPCSTPSWRRCVSLNHAPPSWQRLSHPPSTASGTPSMSSSTSSAPSSTISPPLATSHSHPSSSPPPPPPITSPGSLPLRPSAPLLHSSLPKEPPTRMHASCTRRIQWRWLTTRRHTSRTQRCSGWSDSLRRHRIHFQRRTLQPRRCICTSLYGSSQHPPSSCQRHIGLTNLTRLHQPSKRHWYRWDIYPAASGAICQSWRTCRIWLTHSTKKKKRKRKKKRRERGTPLHHQNTH